MAAAALTGAVPLPPQARPIVERAEAELRRFLQTQRQAFRVEDPDVLLLFDELDRVIDSGGKRLRPLFCCLGYLAAGREVDEPAIRAAAALELLHTFAIVHDDVMDRSRSRRGVPATWVHLADAHRKEGFPGDPDGYGLAGAILLGDLALVLAGRALRESGFGDGRLLPALERYDRMRAEVVAGQYLDVLAAHRGSADEERARRIAVLKSGGYTVEGPLHIGALLSGGSDELMASLSRYGVALGEAFQLRDDVLGAFGDPEVTGKDRDSDLREGKRTVLVAKAERAASPQDGQLLARLGRPDVTDAELERARSILRDTGALDATLSLIEELVERAKGSIDPALIPRPAATLLADMADLVALRRQ